MRRKKELKILNYVDKTICIMMQSSCLIITTYTYLLTSYILVSHFHAHDASVLLVFFCHFHKTFFFNIILLSLDKLNCYSNNNNNDDDIATAVADAFWMQVIKYWRKSFHINISMQKMTDSPTYKQQFFGAETINGKLSFVFFSSNVGKLFLHFFYFMFKWQKKKNYDIIFGIIYILLR